MTISPSSLNGSWVLRSPNKLRTGGVIAIQFKGGVISSCRCAKQGETFLDSSWRELSKLFDGSWYFSDQNPFHFEKSFKEHSEAKHLLDMRDRFLPYQNLLGAANRTTWTLADSGWRYNHRSGINNHEKRWCILNWMDIYIHYTHPRN